MDGDGSNADMAQLRTRRRFTLAEYAKAKSVSRRLCPPIVPSSTTSVLVSSPASQIPANPPRVDKEASLRRTTKLSVRANQLISQTPASSLAAMATINEPESPLGDQSSNAIENQEEVTLQTLVRTGTGDVDDCGQTTPKEPVVADSPGKANAATSAEQPAKVDASLSRVGPTSDNTTLVATSLFSASELLECIPVDLTPSNPVEPAQQLKTQQEPSRNKNAQSKAKKSKTSESDENSSNIEIRDPQNCLSHEEIQEAAASEIHPVRPKGYTVLDIAETPVSTNENKESDGVSSSKKRQKTSVAAKKPRKTTGRVKRSKKSCQTQQINHQEHPQAMDPLGVGEGLVTPTALIVDTAACEDTVRPADGIMPMDVTSDLVNQSSPRIASERKTQKATPRPGRRRKVLDLDKLNLEEILGRNLDDYARRQEYHRMLHRHKEQFDKARAERYESRQKRKLANSGPGSCVTRKPKRRRYCRGETGQENKISEPTEESAQNASVDCTGHITKEPANDHDLRDEENVQPVSIQPYLQDLESSVCLPVTDAESIFQEVGGSLDKLCPTELISNAETALARGDPPCLELGREEPQRDTQEYPHADAINLNETASSAHIHPFDDCSFADDSSLQHVESDSNGGQPKAVGSRSVEVDCADCMSCELA